MTLATVTGGGASVVVELEQTASAGSNASVAQRRAADLAGANMCSTGRDSFFLLS